MDWLTELTGDPLPWLLKPENPVVRFWTLHDLLDKTTDNPEVQLAQTAIPTFGPVAELFATQKQDGYWIKRDYYLPKFSGTFWILSALGDMGLTTEHEPIRHACEFIFDFQRKHGGFCRRRYIQGRGTVWADQPGPCTHARIVRFLIQFGYGADSRTRAAIDWLLTNQRDDGMWHCGKSSQPGCLRATHDYLRAAVLDPEILSHPATTRAATALVELLMEPRMRRYHSKEMWTVLQYPYISYSVITSMEVLAQCGYTVEHPKMAQAMGYLRDRQSSDGAWPLDHVVNHPPFDVGRPGEPNKWLTLDALRVIKLLYGSDH
jgi:hypothetical protein